MGAIFALILLFGGFPEYQHRIWRDAMATWRAEVAASKDPAITIPSDTPIWTSRLPVPVEEYPFDPGTAEGAGA
jgi:hypothetical protein